MFVLEKLIGGGHFGSVYVAHPKFDPKRKYAVKSLEKAKISDRSLKRLESELEILEQLDHPNLVRYYATFVNADCIHIVMEYCKGGEVLTRIKRNGILQEHQAANILRSILQAVKMLHTIGICHRDLKPENIMFMNGDDEVKLIDFGLSKKFNMGNYGD